MKKICSIIFFTLLSISLFGQNVVTKVIGKIKKADGTYVRIGTKLNEKEILQFSSKQDALRMIVPGKGTYIVSPSSNAVKKENVWLELLSKTNRKEDFSGVGSTRSQLDEKFPEAFQTDEKINPFILISNSQTNKYLFNPAEYDLTTGNVFFIQFYYGDKDFSNQILRTSKDTILIYRTDLQPSNGSTKVISYKIGFYNLSEKKIIQNMTIRPYFDDAGEMEAIMKTLIVDNKNKSKDTLRELCYNEVYKTLGKPSYLFYTATFSKILEEINNPVAVNKQFKKGLTDDRESYEKTPKLRRKIMRDQEDLPAQFSLREFTPKVQSQGNYGTCVAWSSAYAARTIAWSVRNKFNNIDNALDISNYSFSPQFLYLNIKSPDDAKCEKGTGMVQALDFMKEKGVVIWDNATYDCSLAFSENELKNAEKYKIQSYERLSSWFNIQDSTILDMKRALSEKKPLLVGMHLPYSFYTVDRRTGIWYPYPEDYKEAEKVKNKKAKYEGHAMCIIGYNDNKSINGGSFEIMNSWGEEAGKNGFYWVSYDDMKIFASQVLIIDDSKTK